MIYKFKFEVCDDDNKLLSGLGEESGDFWKILNKFLAVVLNYAKEHGLVKNGK